MRPFFALWHKDDLFYLFIFAHRSHHTKVDRMDLVGSVEDSDVIIVDDMIDTAGTLCKAASVLKEYGGERDVQASTISYRMYDDVYQPFPIYHPLVVAGKDTSNVGEGFSTVRLRKQGENKQRPLFRRGCTTFFVRE